VSNIKKVIVAGIEMESFRREIPKRATFFLSTTQLGWTSFIHFSFIKTSETEEKKRKTRLCIGKGLSFKGCS